MPTTDPLVILVVVIVALVLGIPTILVFFKK